MVNASKRPTLSVGASKNRRTEDAIPISRNKQPFNQISLLFLIFSTVTPRAPFGVVNFSLLFRTSDEVGFDFLEALLGEGSIGPQYLKFLNLFYERRLGRRDVRVARIECEFGEEIDRGNNNRVKAPTELGVCYPG